MASSKGTVSKTGTLIRAGDIVRFNTGRTSLMRIESIDIEHGESRVYGTNILGDHHAAFAHNCTKATPEDMLVWGSYTQDRHASYREWGQAIDAAPGDVVESGDETRG